MTVTETITTYGYDGANRLVSHVNNKSDNSLIASYSFPILDGVGNRMQAEINEPLAPVVNPESTAYTYNEKKNRLETAGATTFGYDLEGQIATSNNSVIVSLSNYCRVSAKIPTQFQKNSPVSFKLIPHLGSE